MSIEERTNPDANSSALSSPGTAEARIVSIPRGPPSGRVRRDSTGRDPRHNIATWPVFVLDKNLKDQLSTNRQHNRASFSYRCLVPPTSQRPRLCAYTRCVHRSRFNGVRSGSYRPGAVPPGDVAFRPTFESVRRKRIGTKQHRGAAGCVSFHVRHKASRVATPDINRPKQYGSPDAAARGP